MLQCNYDSGTYDVYADLVGDIYAVSRGEVELDPHSDKLKWLIKNGELAIKRGVADERRLVPQLQKLKNLADTRPKTEEHQSALWKALNEALIDAEGFYVEQTQKEVQKWRDRFPKEQHNLHKFLRQIKNATKSHKQSRSEQDKRRRSCLQSLNEKDRFDAKIPTLYGAGRGLADFYGLGIPAMSVFYYFAMFGWNFKWFEFYRPTIQTHTGIKSESPVRKGINELVKVKLIELETKTTGRLCKTGLLKYVEEGADTEIVNPKKKATNRTAFTPRLKTSQESGLDI